ncbi:hypothetical protein JTB14_006594 [Gonioctena quinquepunctata]|nr:hypothetical protein JTB14_006594 [Gonioctena quinquepunctata]
MGVRCIFLLWMIFGAVFFGSTRAQRGFTVCDVQGCNCTLTTATWKIVNCSLQNEQKVNFEQYIIPKEVTEIFIFGGKKIIFSPKTFDALQGLTLIRIEGTRKIVMEKKSFS